MREMNDHRGKKWWAFWRRSAKENAVSEETVCADGESAEKKEEPQESQTEDVREEKQEGALSQETDGGKAKEEKAEGAEGASVEEAETAAGEAEEKPEEEAEGTAEVSEEREEEKAEGAEGASGEEAETAPGEAEEKPEEEAEGAAEVSEEREEEKAESAEGASGEEGKTAPGETEEKPEEASVEEAEPEEKENNNQETASGEAAEGTETESSSENKEEVPLSELIRDNGNGLDHDLSAEEREEEEREKADQAAYEARRQIRMARLKRRRTRRKLQRMAGTAALLLIALMAAGAGGVYMGLIKPETVESVVTTAEAAMDTIKEKVSETLGSAGEIQQGPSGESGTEEQEPSGDTAAEENAGEKEEQEPSGDAAAEGDTDTEKEQEPSGESGTEEKPEDQESQESSGETGTEENTEQEKQEAPGEDGAEENAGGEDPDADSKETAAPALTDSPEYVPTAEDRALLEQAEYLAAQYYYTKAIQLLKDSEHYSLNKDMQAAVKEYRRIRKTCKSWPLEEVTHVFYHSLIKDTSKAFDGEYTAGDYNQVMTTIDEFNKITQTMYERGYVLVSLHDLAKVGKDGTMKRGNINLPPGKIPFVLSQDDVSYYHYMDGDGFASKLIVDEEGRIRNEYVEDDGSVTVGDFDVVPLLDRFLEQHPDFSYHGARGIVALTGYNGILGYRTDISYETRPDDLNWDKVEWLDAHPDFSLEEERAGAKKVADAMRKEGWLFASHTWGHKNVGETSLDRLITDTEKFKENVDPLIGGTDIIIFAFGTDLTTEPEYSGDKFEYFKSQGYNYFCNVDSSRYFVQIRDNYLRMGRRNLDGYRMYYNPEMLEDLFDVKEVFDPSRPTPVPPMS